MPNIPYRLAFFADKDEALACENMSAGDFLRRFAFAFQLVCFQIPIFIRHFDRLQDSLLYDNIGTSRSHNQGKINVAVPSLPLPVAELGAFPLLHRLPSSNLP